MTDYYEEAGLSMEGASILVRFYKNERRFEIIFTENARSWLTDQRLGLNDDGKAFPIGELNREYLHNKLREYIVEFILQDGERQ